MASAEVGQLQFLSRVFGSLLERYRPRRLAVVGCATGNGFEHVDPAVTRAVIGIDIHPGYLAVLRSRFGGKIPGMELRCEDVADCVLPPGSLDLVHCALVFEYVDPSIVVDRLVSWLSPGGVLSAVLQIESSGHESVTPTAFRSLERLGPVMRLVSPAKLGRLAARAGLECEESCVETLESGKRFHVGVYRSVTRA